MNLEGWCRPIERLLSSGLDKVGRQSQKKCIIRRQDVHTQEGNKLLTDKNKKKANQCFGII